VGAPWAIGNEPGQNGEQADLYGYHAPGSDNHIDFTNPDAYQWWKEKIVEFATAYGVHGWKLDRGDEDQPSLAWQIYDDGRNGLEMRNAYPLLYHQCYFEAMKEAWDGDFVNILRTAWAGSQSYGVLWGGDTRGAVYGPFGGQYPTDMGLRSAILSQLHAAFMGFPIWGSDTGGYHEFRNRDTFARWIEFSAFSPIMEIGGIGKHAPWDMPVDPAYDEEMIDIYRTYTQLHHDLSSYIYDYALLAGEDGRAWSADGLCASGGPNVRDIWDQYYLGDDILVAPVWKLDQRERQVYIPSGQFVSYWEPDFIITGPQTITVETPLDVIPFLFIRVRKCLVVSGDQNMNTKRHIAGFNQSGMDGYTKFAFRNNERGDFL